MDSHQNVLLQQHVYPQWCVSAGGSAVSDARAEDVSEVDVGAAQEIGFVNKQRVELTVGEIEASYIGAVPTLWDAAAATGNAETQ
jgi:hypothetical protein